MTYQERLEEMKKTLLKLKTSCDKGMCSKEEFDIVSRQQIMSLGFILSEAILLLMEDKSSIK